MRSILQKTDTIDIDMLLVKKILTRRCMIHLGVYSRQAAAQGSLKTA